MQSGFRPDVEGLRALAVVPILLFHLNVALCPGGFAGVDVFFVISGYLITRMIVMSGEDFNFKTFYYRRFFRLFPALLTICQIALIAGWFILTPDDFIKLAWSALAAAFGLSNFYFYATLDYFSDANIYHALLHTWSLGVEEQFYLFWPALLILLLRARGPFLPLVILVAIASFSSLFLVQQVDAEMAFYWMPFRIFEFAAGASLVRLDGVWAKRSTPGLNTLIGSLGLVLLICTFYLLNEDVAWPSVSSLAPTLGTMLLILAGQAGLWRELLSNPVLRYLGRISYSLYLVHWPILVFFRYYNVMPPSVLEVALLGFASIAGATLLFFLVEQPFRIKSQHAALVQWKLTTKILAPLNRLWPRARQPILAGSTLLFVSASIAVIMSNGVPSRVDQKRVQWLDKGLTFAGDLCDYKRSRCVFGDRTASNIVFVVGDSHALNLIHGLDRLFRAQNIKGIAFYDHGCFFAFGTTRFIKGRKDRKCAKRVQKTYDYLKNTNHPIIFASAFSGYRNAIGPSSATKPLRQTEEEYYSWLGQQLIASLAQINAERRNFVLFKQTYSTGIDLTKCFYRPHFQSDIENNNKKCAALSRSQVMAEYRKADRMVENVASAFPTVRLIDPKAVFCKSEVCITDKSGALFFRDTTHLTFHGSEYLIENAKHELLHALHLR